MLKLLATRIATHKTYMLIYNMYTFTTLIKNEVLFTRKQDNRTTSGLQDNNQPIKGIECMTFVVYCLSAFIPVTNSRKT